MKPQNFILWLLLLSSAAATAQTNGTTENARRLSKSYFYISPLNFAASQFLVGFEWDIGEKHGLEFLPGIILNGQMNEYVDLGVTAELQYRYHMLAISRPKDGDKIKFRFSFYMAPFVQYQYLEYEYDNYSYNYNSGYDTIYTKKDHFNGVSGGILFGAKCTFFERFSVDTYMGGGIKYSDHDLNSSDLGGIFLPGYTGIIGKGNLQIGLAF